MSRIGKLAIPVPNGTTVSVEGQTIKAKGPKGEMTFTVAEVITPKFENGELSVMPRADLVKAAEDRIAQEKARGRRLPTFAEALDSTDEERRALQARVFNSLGEQLAQKATYDFDEAKRWFHRSITLKEKLKPQDKPGLARAYGGLGRLYLFAARDHDGETRENLLHQAQEHFQEDIELCKDYGDISGECQMHSHLGECSLLLECYKDAALSYERSLALAQNPISQGFALIGLIRSHDALGEAEAASETAGTICALALEHDLPPFLRPMLLEVLDLPTVHAEGIASWDDARHALGDVGSAGEEE